MFPPSTAKRRTAQCRHTLLLWLVSLGSLALAEAAQLTASLDRTTLRVGETAKLSLNFENCQPSEAPDLPRVPNLQFAYGGQMSSYSFVNGQQSAVLTLNYFITASQPGDYTIPRITAVVGQDRLGTEPLKLKVVKSDEKVAASEAQGQLAFLRLVAKTNAYVGEVVPVEIQLYVVSGQDLQMQPLSGAGFTFGKAQQLPQRQVQIGNGVYHLVTLKTTAVANRAGSLQLGPAECRLSLRVPTNRRRTGDPFDDFFNDPFGSRYELRPVKLASDPVQINVLPLPTEGQPPSFAGTVGEFTFQVSATPTNAAVGEPIHLKIQVAGRGALEAINLPALDHWQDFTTYPPTTSVEATDPLGVEGAKTFQYDVVPQSTAIKELPALAFAFFDPSRQSYRTLSQPPIPIIVRPAGGATPLAPVAAKPGSPPPGPAAPQDIVGVKQRLGALAQIQPPWITQGWFLGLQAVPLALLAAAYALRRRREHLEQNPRAARRLATQRLLRQGLTDLSRHAQAGDADSFFALLFRLLQEQLGERLDLPSAAITEAVLDEQLQGREVPEDLLRNLHELFQSCNQQRYAAGATRHDLAALRAQVETALRQLQRLKL